MECGPWCLFIVSQQCRLDGFNQQYQFNGNKHLLRTILLAGVEPDDRVWRGGGIVSLKTVCITANYGLYAK